MNSSNKRILILLGAGAADPWCGPSSSNLTKSLKSEISLKTTTGFNIVEFISDQLEKILNKEDNEKINFETIINVIERLYYHLNNDNYIQGNKFYNYNSELEQIFNKAILNNGAIDNGDLPSYQEKLLILEKIYYELIELIIRKTEQYSINIVQSKYTQLNNNLSCFFNVLKNNNYLSRIYSLNYEKIIYDICNNDIDFDLGFDLSKKIPHEISTDILYNSFDPNLIYNSFNKNCHYNLHGSIHFCKKNYFSDGYEFCENYYSGLKTNFSKKETNSGEFILTSPIITGYSKIQQTVIEPFRTFFSCFTQDCYKADIILIIGFSFGDEYINKMIKNVTNINNTKVICIGRPSENHITFAESKIQSIYNKIYQSGNCHNIVNVDYFKLQSNNFYFLPIGFKAFLENQEHYYKLFELK